MVAIVFAGLSVWNLVNRHRFNMAAVLGGVAAALFFMYLFSPTLVSRFYRSWMRLAAILGHVNSRIFLGVMFYLVMTPFGVCLRLLGHDPLRRRDVKQEGYWIKRKTARQTKEGFEHSF